MWIRGTGFAQKGPIAPTLPDSIRVRIESLAGSVPGRRVDRNMEIVNSSDT